MRVVPAVWRRVRRLVAVGALLIAIVAFSASDAAAFVPRVPDSLFGISAPEQWAMTVQGKDAGRDAQLSGIKAAGLDWVRAEVGWREIEPTAPQSGHHSYDWSLADNYVTALANHGLQLFPMAMVAPDWAKDPAAAAAGCDRRSAVSPDHAGDYGAFVAALVGRYGSGGGFWVANPNLPYRPVTRVEVWNEANFRGFWCPAPDPETFASMVQEAADAAHAVDPNVDVVLGGLAAFKEARYDNQGLVGIAADEFLRRMLTRDPGLAGRIDAVGFHLYELDPDVDISLLGWLRQRMNADGLGAAGIALTEFGWHGGQAAGALSENQRAGNYRQFTDQVARTDCGVTAVAAHEWSSAERNPMKVDDWWGIASPSSGVLYPSGQAYAAEVALFEGRGPVPAPSATINVCGGPPSPTADPPRVSPPAAAADFFGVSVVQLPTDPLQWGSQFRAMHDAHIGEVQQEIQWRRIEPEGPSPYGSAGWSWLDGLVLKMGLQGIGLTPSFGAAPPWAAGAGGGFESAYAGFMARLARRYGRGGSFWTENQHLNPGLAVRNFEVWDYGNLDGYAPGGTASASSYASLYAKVRPALRSVDPGARAIVPVSDLGNAGNASPFIRAMVASRPELAGRIDGVLVMANYTQTMTGIDALVRHMRLALDHTGNSAAPIYLGFGASTRGLTAMSDSDRAQLFRDVVRRMARPGSGVGGLFANAWTTPQQDASNPWDWFGIADPTTAALNETGVAYRNVAGRFLGYGPGPAPRAVVHVGPFRRPPG